MFIVKRKEKRIMYIYYAPVSIPLILHISWGNLKFKYFLIRIIAYLLLYTHSLSLSLYICFYDYQICVVFVIIKFKKKGKLDF